MASLNQVSIELQVQGEREATQALKRYSDASDKLTRSVLNAAGKIEQTSSGWDRANKLFEKGVLNTKGLQAAQTQLARELAVVNGYVKSNGALNTQKAIAELKAVQATKQAAAAEAQANAERQRAQQSYRQLKAAIDPAYASQQRLTQGVQTIRAALRAKEISLQEATIALRQLRAAQDAAAQGSQFASRGLNRTGVVAQQAGYQVGDFFVQIQSGTNMMVAFGQQATQLVGTFAMFARTTRAAMIASGIGIFVSIATTVGAAIMRMNGQMETLDTKVQKLETSFNDVAAAMDRLEDSDLSQTFGNLTSDIQSITSAMVELNNAAALTNLTSVFEKLEETADAGFLKNLEAGVKNLSGILLGPFAEYTTSEDLNKEAFQKLGFDMARSQYLRYLDELQKLAGQGDIEGVTTRIRTFFEDATDGAGEVSAKGMVVAQALESAALQAAKFAARQNGSAEAAKLAAAEAERQAEEEKEKNKYISESAEMFLSAQQRIREENGKTMQERIDAEQKAAEARNKYISESAEMFLAAQQRIREENGKTMQERIDAEQKVAEEIQAGYAASSGMSQTLRLETEAYVSEMAEAFKNAESLKEELGDAAYEALRLSGVDISSGVDAAAKAAAALAADLNISLAAAMAMQSMASKEEQVMSQPVVQGPATDRFGTEDLLNMGYTEEYLKAIGKIRATIGDGGGGAGVDPAEEFRKAKEAVDQLRASYDEQYATQLKVQDAQRKVNELIRLNPELTDQANQVLQDYIASLEQAKNPMEDFANNSARQMADAFVSIIDGSKSASDAFKDMARSILEQALRMAVINPIINSIFGGVGGFNPLPTFFENANGNAFNAGRVVPFADGGVVSSPTTFPMAGRQTGLMGEAGPEAIMPLKRGKGGKLGVVAEGGGQQPVVINQSFNFAANGDDSVKKIIAQEAPKIANLTQKQILDQRARGGAFKTTFG